MNRYPSAPPATVGRKAFALTATLFGTDTPPLTELDAKTFSLTPNDGRTLTMTEIPKPTYTEYALLVRAESAEYKIDRLRRILDTILKTDDLKEIRKLAGLGLSAFR